MLCMVEAKHKSREKRECRGNEVKERFWSDSETTVHLL